MSNKSKVVIALGGNAILPKDGDPSFRGQEENVRKAVLSLLSLFKEKLSIVITHGNGPQVGNILRMASCAGKNIPLPYAVAQTQGEMGFMISQVLENELKSAKINTSVLSLVTRVVVSKEDPAFSKPTKPIGPFLNVQEAEKMKEKGLDVVEDAGRGYRQVVPSPIPYSILEKEAIKSLMEQGFVVIATGGGGVPIIKEGDHYEGIPAVIDKDRSSALLALEIEAKDLIILTATDNAYLYFGTDQAKALDHITLAQAKQYLEEGHFAKGSMAPKIAAGIFFLEQGGERVFITTPEYAIECYVHKNKGTWITKN